MKNFVVNSRRLGRVVFTRNEEGHLYIKYPDQEEKKLCCYVGTHTGKPMQTLDDDYFPNLCRNWLSSRNKKIVTRERFIKRNPHRDYELL
jgi:hypothetical protein